ncbi:cytochrome P450 [Actinoplanes sp. NPDC049681]|uniref:cytochrome P450 n=1 Tax=Actinoplanes sp. NPDC049681 TaxID=3363905 RepID=UPI00378C9513
MSVESQSPATAAATAAGCPVHFEAAAPAAASGCPVRLDAAFGHEPYQTYRELQDAGPVQPVVLPDGSEAFMVTRFEDVRQCYFDHKRLSSNLEDAPKPPGADSAPPVGGLVLRRDEVSGHMMINQDPPIHTRLRKLLVQAFAAKRVTAMEPHIVRIANELIDNFRDSDRADLVSDFGKPLPVRVQSVLLGVSPAKQEQLIFDMDELTGGKDTETSQKALDRMKVLIAEEIERKRVEPAEDLLTSLVKAKEEDGRCEEIELLAAAIHVMTAGYFGVQGMIGNCMYWLLKDTEARAQLLANPDLRTTVMDEIFRLDGPQQPGSVRYALEDVEVGGAVIPKGSMVILSLGAASRDPRKFENPDVIDIFRENANDSIAMGAGVHYCLASRMANTEVGLACLTMLQTFPKLRLAVPDEELRWELRIPMRSLDHLPVLLR